MCKCRKERRAVGGPKMEIGFGHGELSCNDWCPFDSCSMGCVFCFPFHNFPTFYFLLFSVHWWINKELDIHEKWWCWPWWSASWRASSVLTLLDRSVWHRRYAKWGMNMVTKDISSSWRQYQRPWAFHTICKSCSVQGGFMCCLSFMYMFRNLVLYNLLLSQSLATFIWDFSHPLPITFAFLFPYLDWEGKLL